MQNSAQFFENRECKFFPCHKGLREGEFNCLFCYCPLYPREVCPGNPTFIKKDDGRIVKRCTDCTFPHKSENYERIMNLLRTKKEECDFSEEFHHGGEVDFCSDFSVNTNPLGLSESVKSSIKNALDLCEKYPDQNCTELREKLAKKISEKRLSPSKPLESESIIFGNGASELISLVVAAISPKNALLLAPTFSGYERALKANGAKIHYHFLKRENKFALDESILDLFEEKRAGRGEAKIPPDMIFLCNPNNPTGQMIEPNLLEKIVALCEEKGIFLVIDECFIDFTERAGETAMRFVGNCPHLIVINAFTKIFAMAGLRLGYLVTSNFALRQKIKFLQPEWSVSSLAQIAGIAALEEEDYIQKTREIVKSERDFLAKELKALGFEVYPSEANFILVNAEDFLMKNFEKRESLADSQLQNIIKMSEKFDNFLKKHGIFLRNCGNFKNLDETYYRLAVKTHEENEKLIEILRSFVYQNSNL